MEHPKVNERIQKKYKVRSQLLHSRETGDAVKMAQPLDYLAGKEFIAPLPAAFKKVLQGEGPMRILDRKVALGYAYTQVVELRECKARSSLVSEGSKYLIPTS